MSNKNKTIDEIQNQNNQSMLKFWQGTEDEFGQSVTQNWYNWKYSSGGSSEPSEWIKTYFIDETTQQRIKYDILSVTYGKNKFVTTGYDDSTQKKIEILNSDDGLNWKVAATIDSSKSAPKSVISFNGSIFTILTNNRISYYSEDGINWNEGTSDNRYNPLDIAYGNGKFIATINGTYKYAYSEDGINWTIQNMSANTTFTTVIYANNKFVMLGKNYSAYSEDGINWTINSFSYGDPYNDVKYGLAYGNGKYVVLNGNNTGAYSEDGINWIELTVPNAKNGTWAHCEYGGGKFVAVSYGNSTLESNYIYSYDGITWNEGTISLARLYTDMIYAQNKFIAMYKGNLFFVMNAPDSQESLIYTKEETPTTESKVYSEPNVESTLTITATTNSSITLSDTNIYDRNVNGDEQTSDGSIGDEHPDYLCFINGVGIKIGNKLIIKNNKKIDVTPDTPTIDPSTLKFGDRIDNKATVVGTFKSSDLGTVVYAVLDAQYRGTKIAWANGLYGIDTGLPNYTSEENVLNATESATYNTDYILNNYSNKETEAFTHCRNIEPLNFNGKKYYGQLPNAYELLQIYNNRNALDTLDSTIEANEDKKLSNWEFASRYACVRSSNEYNSNNSWTLSSDGSWSSRNKSTKVGVVPIIEIQVDKTIIPPVIKS